jgi:hemerythrin
MPRITWDDKYLTGIEKFDDDHKLLVGFLGELYNAFLPGNPGGRSPQEILDSLTAFTIWHFSSEEEWMREVDYPYREQHILEHKAFVLRLSEFRQKLQEGGGHLTLDIISFLRVWLLTHICSTDFQLGIFSGKAEVRMLPDTARQR